MDKKLLNIKEICEYLGIGETKARELVRGHNGFGVRIGNRCYADKNNQIDGLKKQEYENRERRWQIGSEFDIIKSVTEHYLLSAGSNKSTV